MKQIAGTVWLLVLLTFFALPAEAAQEKTAVGGIHIQKTDVTGRALEGAVFQLVRVMEPGELTDAALEKQLHRIGNENHLTAVMSFWPSREMEGSRQKQASTDRNGQAAIYGLPYGTYYLVETEAPEGYNRISGPIRVSIHRYSHLTQEDQIRDDDGKIIDNTLHIINVRYALPDTGSWGRIQLAAAGTGILFSSAALILINRRRKKTGT